MNFNLHLLFRIFYVSFFTILYIVLIGLLLITPADAIRQALDNNQKYNVVAIAVTYFLTGLIASFIYFNRLWLTRTALSKIPKTWIPIEKGEVSKNTRKMIVAGWARSAAIAWDSRPRLAPEPATIVSEPQARDTIAKAPEAEPKEKDRRGFFRKRFTQLEQEEPTVVIPPSTPVWGDIAHNGWASPTSPDLTNLQYTTVILELPHLIEARAVSMAPPDPDSKTEPPLPDIQAVDLLQRPASMGLRDYIGHLMAIGVLTSPPIANDFLAAYEYARFGPRPLSEDEFRDLMAQFSELLRTMSALEMDEESDIDDDASSGSTPVTPRSRSLAPSFTASSRSGSEGTIRTAPSRRVDTVASGRTRRSDFATAPATPRSRRRAVSKSPSVNSFSQSRRPYNMSRGSSSASLRSTSQGSVIKLSRTNEDGELPYTLNIPGAR